MASACACAYVLHMAEEQVAQIFPSQSPRVVAFGILLLVQTFSNMLVPPIVMQSPLRRLRMFVHISKSNIIALGTETGYVTHHHLPTLTYSRFQLVRLFAIDTCLHKAYDSMQVLYNSTPVPILTYHEFCPTLRRFLFIHTLSTNPKRARIDYDEDDVD